MCFNRAILREKNTYRWDCSKCNHNGCTHQVQATIDGFVIDLPGDNFQGLICHYLYFLLLCVNFFGYLFYRLYMFHMLSEKDF